MTIVEKRKQIDDAIAALEKLRDEVPLAETTELVEAIGKLLAKKELLITEDWDDFILQITDDDFKKLREAKAAIVDTTITEQEKIEKIKKGITIGKKILGVLTIL